MENSTKALLIAAGLFLAVMLLALLFVFKDDIGSYFSARHETTMTQQMVEFNRKFESYNGKTIRGNELISIMNKVVDYNDLQAELEGFEKIMLEIDFINSQYINELKYSNERGANSIFSITDSKIRNTKSSDDSLKTISNLSATLVNSAGIEGLTDTKLQRMSAEIANIVDDDIVDSRAKDEYIKYRANLLKRILGYDVSNSKMSEIKTATFKYYQLTQFKRAMFKCKEVGYDETNVRVNKLVFEVILEEDYSGNKHIKFD